MEFAGFILNFKILSLYNRSWEEDHLIHGRHLTATFFFLVSSLENIFCYHERENGKEVEGEKIQT
jgi:hypothetical protein